MSFSRRLSQFLLVLLVSSAIGGFCFFSQAANPIEEKKAEIKRLETRIADQKQDIAEREAKEFNYDNYLARLQVQIAANTDEQSVMKEQVELTKLEITDKEGAIKQEESSLRYHQEVLASYLRELNRFDRTNKMLQLFDTKSFSDFYRQLNFTEILNDKAAQATAEIKSSRNDLELDRDVLVNKRLEQESALALLKVYSEEATRAQAEYQTMKSRNASEIKSLSDVMSSTANQRNKLQQELFAMTSEGQSIKFAEAAKYARYASEKTGIRPELIMSIVKQETDFGNNVGTGTYKSDMNPNQWDDFAKVCLSLKRSPENTPVSARPKSYSGWGGAMGIAQFLPGTWLGIADEVSVITGHKPADPWNPTDAFMAVGVKFQKMGASKTDRNSEWEAAGRYFAGGNFRKFPWYGDNVMNRADVYAEQLKQIP